MRLSGSVCIELSLWLLLSKKCMLVIQSCLTLCGPMDCNPSGSAAHGILQARLLEGVAIPFCRGSSWPRDQTQISCIAGRFFTIWATREAHKGSLILWGLHHRACGILVPQLGIKPASLTSPALASGFFTPAADKPLQSPLAPPEFVFLWNSFQY